VNWVENLVMGGFVVAQLGVAICALALLGARNRRKSVPGLVTNSLALLDRRNVTAHGHRWQRRMGWILVIVLFAAVTFHSTIYLRNAAQSTERDASDSSSAPASTSTSR
jgi:hypothetical protein